MNIYLIGYRCTGKTSVGRRLAEKIGWPFVDTDALVEQQDGRKITAIVAAHGWPVFRRMERETLGAVCAADRQVVATGGGIVLESVNVDRMRQTGRIILLTAGLETIRARMAADEATAGLRPPLTADKSRWEEIRQTLDQRIPLYKAAGDIRVATDSLAVGGVADRIRAALFPEPGP